MRYIALMACLFIIGCCDCPVANEPSLPVAVIDTIPSDSIFAYEKPVVAKKSKKSKKKKKVAKPTEEYSAYTAPAPAPEPARATVYVEPEPVQSYRSPSSSSSQCGGMTKKGRQCSRMVRGGGNCWQH